MFRDRLKELREARGLSQMALSKAVGISNGTIAMYETDKRQPTGENVMKLARFFGVRPEFLLSDTEYPELSMTTDDTAWIDIRKLAEAEGLTPIDVTQAILLYKQQMERSGD